MKIYRIQRRLKKLKCLLALEVYEMAFSIDKIINPNSTIEGIAIPGELGTINLERHKLRIEVQPT